MTFQKYNHGKSTHHGKYSHRFKSHFSNYKLIIKSNKDHINPI